MAIMAKPSTRPRCPATSAGAKRPTVGDEKIGVKRHFEDAAREGEPGFLITPERAHAAPHPDVKTTFFGERGGQFADHQCGGQTPQEWSDEKDQESRAITGFLHDVFEAVGATGDHEVRDRDHGQDGQFAGGGLRAWADGGRIHAFAV